MHASLRNDIAGRLTGPDYQGVDKGRFIQKITCPDCHKREAYAHSDSPWMIYCGRLNNCGAAIHAKDQFPEFFDDWADRYAPKKGEMQRPNAIADAYLSDGRGFDLDRLRGQYSQEHYHDHDRDIGTPTVRFTLPGGATWERLLHKPYRFGSQKARFRGKYKGDAWQLATNDTIADSGEVWLVEGIFDAIALEHHGIHAVADMSAQNFPSDALERIKTAAHSAGTDRPRLVWALDSNKAGRDWALRHAAQARAMGWECDAAQPPWGRDWNDLHQRGELEPEHVERYRYYGDLLLAASAAEKGRLIHNNRGQRTFLFSYNARLYWFELNQKKLEDAIKAITGDDDDDERQLMDSERNRAIEQAATVQQICSAYPTALYYQANEITDESWYYWRIDSPSGRTIQNTFSGGQLSASAEFKKRMLSISPGAVWTGNATQLDRLLQEQLANIKTVETVDYIGYSRQHEAWVLGDVAVSRGRMYQLTSEDYFNLGRLRLKTLSRSLDLDINPQLDQFDTGWIKHLIGAWGVDGVVCLAFWLGSLFAEQIRAEFKSYPFFELVGEPGTGKTTLLEFLWKLTGRTDYEGFDPAKASMAARSRNFAQVSNLPVVLIESDREQDGGAKQRQFDWDELKTAFNGRSIRARGVKNGGNDTYEPPFRGAIVISQNAEVQAGEAIQSRICHIRVDKARQTRDSKEHSEVIEKYQVEDISGFIVKATRAERTVMDILRDRVTSYADYLMSFDEIRAFRIGRNHAQLMALVHALGPEGLAIIDEPTVGEAQARLIDMAKRRQQALNADHPVVEEFWEAYEYLESLNETSPVVNHYGKAPANGLVAVNLKHFEALCTSNRIEAPAAKELKRHLKSSRSRKCIDINRSVKSRINERSTRAWIFEDQRVQHA